MFIWKDANAHGDIYNNDITTSVYRPLLNLAFVLRVFSLRTGCFLPIILLEIESRSHSSDS